MSTTAISLVASQRRAVEAVLDRHRVPPGEAPALVAHALLAVTADEGGKPPAGAAPAERLVRALDIACARRTAAGLAAGPPETEPPTAAAPPPARDDDSTFAILLEGVAGHWRAHRERLESERREAPSRAALALARPADADAAALASRGVVEHLLHAATAAWVDRPHHARQLAGLALAAARRLDPEVYGAAAVADIEAWALATRANADRVIGDLTAADRGLDEAGKALAAGSRDPRLRARVLRYTATLRRAQGLSAEALRLLDQAAAVYRWLGDRHHEGRTLLQRALLVEDDDPAQAAELLARALDRLDLSREPRLELVALHNLVATLRRAGEVDEAAALLPRVRSAAERLGGRFDRLRLRWLAALVAADGAAGESGDGAADLAAAGVLAAVRDAFLAEEMPLDALLAALDLAALHLARGRTAETRRLADEIAALAVGRPLDRSTFAALLVFQEAARRERATVALARAAAAALRRDRERPRLSPSAS